MSELKEIIQSLKSADAEKFALATIISTEGSSYRRAGARMLIGENGTCVDSVGGGCLEKDVIERARKTMISGKPIIISYDTSTAQDVIFGTGTGCNGVIKILIEPVREKDKTGYFSLLDHCLAERNG